VVAGKSVLITGATSGIGLQTARTLAPLGAHLHLVGRDRERTERTASELSRSSGNDEVHVLVGDLSSLAEVERVANEFLACGEPLDVLVNCAGAVFGFRREESVDGFEMTFALNHLAYFALTMRVLPRLREADAARVVNVTGDAYKDAKGRFDFANYNGEINYRPIRQYGQSKLANILFTRELARRLDGSRITANAVGPHRTSATRFAHNVHPLAKIAMTVARPFLLSPEKATAPVMHACTAAELDGATGTYWSGMNQPELTDAATNDEDAVRLWELSAELTGLDATSL
jgi:NAD(P)-dependent dehydrogenase (short-subunit alcohol dehydrogenase family)